YLVLNVPASLQSEWNKLNGVTVGNLNIELSKYTENWLGWFYLTQENIERLIFNFYYPRGLFAVRTDGKNAAKGSAYDIEYQELSGVDPVGPILTISNQIVKQEQSAFGMSEVIDLLSPFSDGVRFRMRKTSMDIYLRLAVYDELKV